MPILFVVLVAVALFLYGFGNAWSNIRAALGLAWDGAEYVLVYTEFAAQQFWRRYLRWFLLFSLGLFAISLGLMIWGVYRDGTYLEKAVPVAIGAMLFGGLTAFFALFAEAIERVVEAVIDALSGAAWALARLASVFLSIFEIMNRLGPHTPPVRDPLRRRITEALFMPPVLLWFWNGAFLTAFPHAKMWGLLVLLNLCLIFGALLVRWLRKEQWFWKLTYGFTLPALMGVMILRTLFPGPIDLAGRTIERGYVYVACLLDGSTTVDKACKEMFIREALEDAEDLARKGEKLALRHSGGGAIAAGPAPTAAPPPPPLGSAPPPSPPSGGDADAPPVP